MSNLKTIYYYPELREEVGSINAVIIMGYLESCFDEKGQVFYKFMEPCNHRDYVRGESCVEELGMTAAEFRTAFKYIGVVYKSKKAFNLSKDKFQGKMYLSYYDRMNKLTYYMRNDEMMNKIRKEMDEANEEYNGEELARSQHIGRIMGDDKEEIKDEEISELEKTREREEEIDTEETETRETKEQEESEPEVREEDKLVIRNEECLNAVDQESSDPIYNKSTDSKSYLLSLHHHSNTENKDYESIDLSLSSNSNTNIINSNVYANNDTQLIDSCFNEKHANGDTQFVDTTDNCQVPFEGIKGLFNQICKSFETITEWTNWQKQKLELIWVKYERDLEIFRIAFEQLEESDFLCGRKKSWKAYMGWILKPYHFADILMGKYRNYQRNAYEEKGQEQREVAKDTRGERSYEESYVEMQSHDWDFDEIERLERRRIDKILEERHGALQFC